MLNGIRKYIFKHDINPKQKFVNAKLWLRVAELNIFIDF